MANPKGLKLSKSEVSQTINVKEALGKALDDEGMEKIGSLIVDYMIDRTQSGHDRSGKSFKRYSESYAEKKGVGVNDVDMTLFGDMLGAIEVEKKSKNVLKIKVGGEDVETLKAYNHNVGDTLPRRPFFGISKKEINEIGKAIKGAAKEKKPKKKLTAGDLAGAIPSTQDQIDRFLREFDLIPEE